MSFNAQGQYFQTLGRDPCAVGSVISTDPAGNARTLRGTKVAVTVSKGPERYAMPEVVGQELSGPAPPSNRRIWQSGR